MTQTTAVGALPVDMGTLPAATVQMGWKRILTDPKVILGTVAFVLLLISGAVAGRGSTPAEKLDFYKSAVWAGAGIYIAVLGALGYETGKLLEGVVPSGFLPANAPAAIARPLQADTLMAISPSMYEQVRQALKDHAADVGKVGVILLAFMFCGGCASTSQVFKQTIGAGVNNVVQDLHDYQANRNWDLNADGVIDSIEATARLTEMGKTDTLAASVADKSNITVDGVDSAWQPVKPIYLQYVANEPGIDEASRQNFQATAKAIDDLIAEERARQANLFNFFSNSSTTQPAKP